MRLDDELVNSFKAGLVGQVTFHDGTDRAVSVDFSLKGFTAGFKELP